MRIPPYPERGLSADELATAQTGNEGGDPLERRLCRDGRTNAAERPGKIARGDTTAPDTHRFCLPNGEVTAEFFGQRYSMAHPSTIGVRVRGTEPRLGHSPGDVHKSLL